MAITEAGDRLLVARFLSPATRGEIYDIALSGANMSLSGVIELSHPSEYVPASVFDVRCYAPDNVEVGSLDVSK